MVRSRAKLTCKPRTGQSVLRLEVRPLSESGVSVRRYAQTPRGIEDITLIVRSMEVFRRFREADSLRFDHHHEYEQAARTIDRLLHAIGSSRDT